jgi:UDP-N-acetylglucosamine:LPS N-acetylglucosamine transferase
LEPQRTIFEKQILNQAIKTGEHLILVQGLINRSTTNIKHGHVEIIPHLSDEALLQKMQQSNKIIARSGYSTIMDLAYLNLLDKAELHPTPGQSEQEYLAEKFKILKTS